MWGDELSYNNVLMHAVSVTTAPSGGPSASRRGAEDERGAERSPGATEPLIRRTPTFWGPSQNRAPQGGWSEPRPSHAAQYTGTRTLGFTRPENEGTKKESSEGWS